MTRNLIIGLGEVGTAIRKVFGNAETRYYDNKQDKFPQNISDIEYMHICFPYSKTFIDDVQTYQATFHPKYTIIHSSVPVGTTVQVHTKTVHAPIRGLHPDLEKGIRTFAMFIGGGYGSEVADYFRRAGLKIILVDNSEATEAGKLFDTEYYKVCIEFAKRVKEYCNEYELNFHEVYTLFNDTYNKGYLSLHRPEFVRPVLQPIMTPIGGHCVENNSKLLGE